MRMAGVFSSAIQAIDTNVKARQTATNFCMIHLGHLVGGMRQGMTSRWLLVSLVALGTATSSFASAQQRSRTPDPQIYTDELSPRQFQREPDPDPRFERRVAPSSRVQPPPARSQTQPQRQPTSYPPAQPTAQPARAVTCGGAFAKDSSHLKLATAYKPENIVFTEVDASEGKKLMATVLFPKDPKRRLEVWWENETSRSGTYLIVINGQSTWSAPKGLKLGLQIAQLERLNGKPFKLKGFGSGSDASVSDWQGGALESIAGGCKVGVSMRADPKAPPNAVEQAASELASTDAAVKAIKPAVAEIIVGY
jgi:hypothetical protein